MRSFANDGWALTDRMRNMCFLPRIEIFSINMVLRSWNVRGFVSRKFPGLALEGNVKDYVCSRVEQSKKTS